MSNRIRLQGAMMIPDNRLRKRSRKHLTVRRGNELTDGRIDNSDPFYRVISIRWSKMMTPTGHGPIGVGRSILYRTQRSTTVTAYTVSDGTLYPHM